MPGLPDGSGRRRRSAIVGAAGQLCTSGLAAAASVEDGEQVKRVIALLLAVAAALYPVCCFAADPPEEKRVMQVQPGEDMEAVLDRLEKQGYWDSGPARMVKDSGRVPGSVIDIRDPTITVDEAIYQIRYCLIFLIYGVIPLICACVILYFFFRWIYRLIVGAV